MTSPTQLRRFILLALLLVVGPLNVQPAFACSVMGQIVHGACCCDESAKMHGRIAASPEAHTPCCAPSAELTYETGAAAMLLTPTSLPTHHEPPPAAVSVLAPWPTEVVGSVAPRSAMILLPSRGQSSLYLTTLRLRI